MQSEIVGIYGGINQSFSEEFKPDKNPVFIDKFENLAPLVTLDQSEGYFGEFVCKICNSGFSSSVDTRVLPCKHAFHGQCIYDFIIKGNNNFCPVCK